MSNLAAIPMSVDASPGQLTNVLAGVAQAQQVMQQQKKMQAQNALAKVFSNPQSLDAQGDLTPQSLAAVGALDPEAMMAIKKQQIDQRVAMWHEQTAKTELGAAQADILTGSAAAGVTARRLALKAGKPPADADAAAVQARNEFLDANGGGLSNEMRDKVKSTPYDSIGAEAMARRNKDFIAAEKEEDTNKRADAKDIRDDIKETHKEEEDAIRDSRLLAAVGSRGGAETPLGDPIVREKPDGTKERGWYERDKAGNPRWVPAPEDGSTTLGKVGGKGSASFDPADGELMAALAERGVSIPAGFRSKDQQAALYRGLRDRNKDKTPDEIAEGIAKGQIEFGAQKKETQTAAGQAGKVEVAQNELENFIPLVREAAAEVPRGRFMPLTRLMQSADTELSDPKLKALKIRINSVLNAYDQLAARGGTDAEKRKEARSLITSADSPAALEAGLKSFELEAKAAHDAAVKATRVPELSTGNKKKSDDPDDFSHLWK